MQLQSFQWFIDLQADGSLTLWSALETLRWLFRLPGSLVMELLGSAHLHGLAAKGISLLFWLPLLVWALNLGSKPKPRQHDPADEHPPQPLLLPMPKDYMRFYMHS